MGIKVLNPPNSVTDVVEKVLLCSYKRLAEEYLADRELPLLCVSVPYYQVSAVLRSKMQTLSVFQSWIHILPTLTGSTVLSDFTVSRVCVFVSGIVVYVHLSGVWIGARHYVLIQFRDLLKLIRELSVVSIVFIHYVILVLEKLCISLSEMKKNRWSLDHQANVHSHEVSCEDVEV